MRIVGEVPRLEIYPKEVTELFENVLLGRCPRHAVAFSRIRHTSDHSRGMRRLFCFRNERRNLGERHVDICLQQKSALR